MARVGAVNAVKDPLEGLSELHGFVGGLCDGLIVDTNEGVVADGSWPAIPLWNHSQWAEA